MAPPDPLRSSRALLGPVAVSAAGVFGILDRPTATALVGERAVEASAQALARPGAPALPLPTSVLIAVSDEWIHVCDWDAEVGTGAELARLNRATATMAVQEYQTARRILLSDQATGYRLVLTATVSGFSPYGAGAKAVLGLLPA